MDTGTLDRAAGTLPRLRTAAAAVLLAGAGVVALLQAPVLPASDAARVAALVEDTCEAFRIGDEAALAHLLDERYLLVTSTGAVSGKAEALANARAQERPGSVRTHDLEVTVHGDTAVAVGVLSVRGADGTARNLRFTETAVARDGTWRVVATHVSALR